MSVRKCVTTSLALFVLGLLLCGPPSQNSRSLNPVKTANADNSAGDNSLPVPGKEIVRELSAGRTDTYHVSLNQGSYLRAVVEGQGGDVLVTVYDPGGRSTLNVDCREYRPLPVSLIADVPGSYRLEVQASGESNATGR